MLSLASDSSDAQVTPSFANICARTTIFPSLRACIWGVRACMRACVRLPSERCEHACAAFFAQVVCKLDKPFHKAIATYPCIALTNKATA
jgi:hypothetical protein